MRFIRVPRDIIVWLLLVVSLVLYGVDYLLYGRLQEIAFGFMANLAFLPVYVLFVTLMIERVLKEREREAIMKKLNMVIGVFFSEVGNHLLHDFLAFTCDGRKLSERLSFTPQWEDEDFAAALAFVKGHDFCLDSTLGDREALKAFLVEKRGVMLSLMENPNLLEHEAFTDLLWAVFHLIEELQARTKLDRLPESDLDHLSGDMKRAHALLLIQWLNYLRHLRQDYPYLFSLAVRMNPMNPEASAEVVYR
ncbi:hypothetical protein LPW11_13520 [Geomonas sp. RF6]|uniref:hypothetical protein n=1 Tax=Geomonas sp. RF6 TaxID=2897342 RepID=UPI001E2944EF|nr:hypothetical protein [Geomonas sp. RF6]UFS68915.1 hypothetical protein LPW11_13520 [Geomonas sp. RF6]